MTRYVGDRTIDGVQVRADGQPLPAGDEVRAFSANGFEWSYEGPEPRQLALALLLHHLGAPERALPLVEPFMKAVVANFDNEWEMDSADVQDAIDALGGAGGRPVRGAGR